MEGFSTPDFNVHRGERASTVARYLRPAMSRSNLQVITGAHASRLIIEGRRVRGVECHVNGEPRHFECQREVVLAAGAIGSPQLLLLSGIGPPFATGRLRCTTRTRAAWRGQQSPGPPVAGRDVQVTAAAHLRDSVAPRSLRALAAALAVVSQRTGGRSAGRGPGLRAHRARTRSPRPADAGQSGIHGGAALVPAVATRRGPRALHRLRALASGQPWPGEPALGRPARSTAGAARPFAGG